MDLVSPIPAVLVLLLAQLTAYILARISHSVPASDRYVSIDGLRGYLALSVFMHHSVMWYYYVHTDKWAWPKSNLYRHFGTGGVAIFFMITGFLFASKLLDARTRPIDWTRLYVSRFLRLVPLYFFACAVFFVLIAVLSGFAWHQPLAVIADEVARWLSFTIFGAPDVNGVPRTFAITAGVFWSLPYEWAFYLLLPLLGLLLGSKRPSWIGLGIATPLAAIILLNHRVPMHLAVFGGGIAAALLARLDLSRQLAKSHGSALIVIGCAGLAVANYPSSHHWPALFLLSCAFIIIACGNDLFGLLSNRVSRLLGEMTYGIYLLHGMFLFILFRFVFGFSTAAGFSPLKHWIVIGGCVPILITLCFFTFKLIEAPSMRALPRASKWVNSLARGRVQSSVSGKPVEPPPLP
jgi:peptidoglycan/LPS O-acetylase OafA/YrhL